MLTDIFASLPVHFLRARPTNGSDRGSLRDRNLTLLVRKSTSAETPMATPRRLLRDYEVEAQYGISRFTLRADRTHERRFKFIKIGRSVYYRIEDIEKILESLVVFNSSS